jgi:sugar lactone lactonase YvrE
MARTKFYVGAAVCIAALLSGVALAGVVATSPVVVPDAANNRVLIYNSPTANGDAADVVIGQSDFTTSATGTSSSTMSGPTAYALDSSGNLYVSDSGNCRVLVFHPPFTDGEAASLVIGQPDANTGCSGTVSASTFGRTGGVAIDSRGNLWVVDSGNNRVLKFLAPLKTGEAAKLVVGQPDFVSSGCAAPPTAASLCAPSGITFDSIGVLWVADSSNHRVLAYRAPKKGTANAEYGHPAATAFTSYTFNDGGISASSLFDPTGIGFDSSNRLWVADTMNNRVLIFNRTFHHNGLPASVVLGQTDFTSTKSNQDGSPSAATLSSPQGIVTQFGANVWVGDTSNNRTLRYTSPYSNGMNASLVLGQPDFSQNQGNQGNASPSDQTQNAPFTAGPSLIALAVLAMMAGGWRLRHSLRRAS